MKQSKQLKKRISLLSIVSLSLLFILIAVSLYNNVTQARYRQIDMLVSSLMDYPSHEIVKLIQSEKSQALQELVQDISMNEYVDTISVFDSKGVLIASSDPAYMTKLLEKKQYQQATGIRVYLTPLIFQQQQIGYIQLKFEYQKIMKTFTIFQLDATKSILFLFIILLIFGILIGVTINRVYHSFRASLGKKAKAGVTSNSKKN